MGGEKAGSHLRMATIRVARKGISRVMLLGQHAATKVVGAGYVASGARLLQLDTYETLLVP